MRMLIVGDGPRDSLALTKIIKNILDADFRAEFDAWHHVRHLRGSGTIYAKKLKYLVRRAIAQSFDGIVVVIDADNSQQNEKLKMLQRGRDEDRSTVIFPTALGEARPHFDVWLLDDPVAVRTTLGLSSDHEIQTCTQIGNPKEHLSELVENCDKTWEKISLALEEIADQISIDRCNQKAKTGFAEFVKEIESELKPVVS